MTSLSRRLARAIVPAAALAALAITCDSPTAVRRVVAISATPQFTISGINAIAGLAVDSVRATVTRPPDQVLVSKVFAFSPDSASLSAELDVTINGAHEQLLLRLDFLAGGVLMFTGQDTVDVTAGVKSPNPPIPMAFVGPGNNIKTLHLTPRDSGVAFGSTANFTVTAADSSAQPVSQFYVSWSTSRAADTVNAAGVFHAGNTRGWSWVRVTTPGGVKDSARILVQAAPSAVQALSGGGQTQIAHTTLAQPLVAQVLGSDNLPLTGVAVTFSAPAGGSVVPASGITDTLGRVSTTATLGTAIGAQTFTATVSGLTAATFNETATAGIATHLVFGTQPSATAAGAVITPAVQVVAKDSAGNTAAGYTGTVTIALGANPGGGTLGGTLSATASGGVATFSNLVLNKAAIGYSLVATSGTFAPDTSAAFTITAGAAASIQLISGNNQNGTPSAVLSAPVVVQVGDLFANPVSGRAVTFAVTAGGGSVGTPNATTGTNGQASTTWTLGASGTQTMTATATGLVGSPITVTANITGVATTTVTPKVDTLISLGDTVRIVAQAKNFSGGNVAGTFTWRSSDTTVATVDTAGLVKGLKNGAAYVVATEAGGTRDSASIVVQQRVSTVLVTPGTRSIYLTRTYKFAANAVDGRGNALVSQPVFTWSSTAPAVASVDSTGLVTGTGLGNAQIKATAGTITGVANVSILTPITSIVVALAPSGTTTDLDTMKSLGLTRTYVAIAHDTLDNPMTGVTFTWVSTNGSVAVLDSITATTARATGAANGYTQIQASAQGVTSTPGASLYVAQALASILLTAPAANPSATVAVTGTVNLTARGKDANGRFIPGGYTFTFHSDNPNVASVDSVTGIVTGVSAGTANITATNAAIVSDTVVAHVGGTVPAVISFGRDTLSVGRGASVSIPILLSKPDTAPLIIKLTTADTLENWSTATVTIPAGQTSINATLNGHAAGTGSVTASDSSGAGYASATAVVKVTANMLITCSTCLYGNGLYNFSLNGTDIQGATVALSDPSPAGGTYVVFNFGTSGVASVSPNPAFIPPGQLTASIQITGVAAGTTTITPVATGVNGTASTLTVYAPVISAPTTERLGAGQFDYNNAYVQVPTYTNVAIPITLTRSDTTILGAPPSVTINSGSYYTYFNISGLAVGTATVTPSATGWTANNPITVTVTTPHVGACCGSQLNTTSPTQTFTVYSEDSVGSSHYRINSLVVRVHSTDTTVIKVIDTVVTIAPNTYYAYPHIAPAGLGGSAYVVVSASGHTPDSTLWTVVPPKLIMSPSNSPSYPTLVGLGQYDSNEYVYRPNSSPTPLVVNISNSDTTVLSLPSVDTIPANATYGYFNAVSKGLGSVTLVASATGYAADTGYYRVTSPRLRAACCGGNLYNFGPGTSIYAYSADSTNSTHYRSTPLTVSVHSTDTTKIRVDSTTLTIPAGSYYSSSTHVSAVDTGSAYVVFTAAGQAADSVLYTVISPTLYMSLSSSATYPTLLGRRQSFANGGSGFYVSVPNTRTSPLAVTITQTHPNVDSLTTTSVVIATNTSYTYLDAFGLANGTDTLTVTAPGYLPTTVYLAVTTPQLSTCCMPSTGTTTNPPFTMTVYTRDSAGSTHYAMDTVTVQVTSSDTNVLRPTHTFFKVPKGLYYAYDTIAVVGPGTASLTYADSNVAGPNRYTSSTTSTMTVTGPSFGISNGTPVLGMRQTGGAYSANVYTQNAVTGSPLVVHLLSTSTRVVTVPDSVIIPVGSSYVYFPITAMDTVGTIQIQATATGYTMATTSVQVTQPKFVISTTSQLNTTSPRYPLYVYATDANGSTHYTTDSVTVTLTSSATGVANIDSTSVTIVKGAYYSSTATWGPGVVGTAQLSATDNRAAIYKYTTATYNVAVVQPTVRLNWTTRYLGIGQYDDYAEAYTPDYMRSATAVGLTHLGTAFTSLFANLSSTPLTGLTIDSATSYQYFRIAGSAAGTDSLVVSIASPLHNSDTALTIVTQGRVDPISGWPSAMSLTNNVNPDSALVTIYARDQNTGSHYVLNATTFNLASTNGHIQFVTGGATSSVITSIQIPAGAYYVQFYVKGVSQGSDTATITATNYTTYVTPTITVGP